MKVFTSDASWQEWIDHLRRMDSGRDGFDPDESNCPITSWGRSLGDVRLCEAITIENATHTHGREAFMWFLMNAYCDLPAPEQEIVIQTALSDPRLAAIAWLKGRNLPDTVRQRLLERCRDVPVVRHHLSKIRDIKAANAGGKA